MFICQYAIRCDMRRHSDRDTDSLAEAEPAVQAVATAMPGKETGGGIYCPGCRQCLETVSDIGSLSHWHSTCGTCSTDLFPFTAVFVPYTVQSPSHRELYLTMQTYWARVLETDCRSSQPVSVSSGDSGARSDDAHPSRRSPTTLSTRSIYKPEIKAAIQAFQWDFELKECATASTA